MSDTATKEAEKELRALKRQAREVWKETARKRGNPYVDNRALWLVGAMAEEATRWEDGLVILEAIRVHMDHRSSPRRIPEWSRIVGAQKRELQHMALKHATTEPPVDPEVRAALAAIRAKPIPRSHEEDALLTTFASHRERGTDPKMCCHTCDYVRANLLQGERSGNRS